MCTVVHLEPEDFARELVHNQKMFMQNVCPRLWACRNYLYVSRFAFPILLRQTGLSKEKKDMLKSMDFYELHAEIYRKVNLDNRLRERQNNPS